MPKRWRCCKCDNGPMTVKEENICTYTPCGHVKCGGCEEKYESVPLGPFGGPLFDEELSPDLDTHTYDCSSMSPSRLCCERPHNFATTLG